MPADIKFIKIKTEVKMMAYLAHACIEKCYVLENPDILALSDHNPVVAHLSL